MNKQEKIKACQVTVIMRSLDNTPFSAPGRDKALHTAARMMGELVKGARSNKARVELMQLSNAWALSGLSAFTMARWGE